MSFDLSPETESLSASPSVSPPTPLSPVSDPSSASPVAPEIQAFISTPSALLTSAPSEGVFSQLSSKRASLLSGLPATLFPTGVRVEIGQGYTKIISYEDFLEVVNELVGEKKNEDIGTSFNLPLGCFWINQTKDKLELACFYPEGKRPLVFSNSLSSAPSTREVIAPNIIILHSLKKKEKAGEWTLAASWYFCTNKGVEEFPRTKPSLTNRSISILPFSNVYDDGRLCMGENQGIINYKDNNLAPLNWYFDLLWASPFNNDLGVRAVHRYDTVGTWYSDLAALAKEGKPFPYHRLIRFM